MFPGLSFLSLFNLLSIATFFAFVNLFPAFFPFVPHLLVAVRNHFTDFILCHTAVQRDGVPVHLIHMVARCDRRIDASPEISLHWLAFDVNP